MPCAKFLPGLAVVASALTFGPVIDLFDVFTVRPAYADEAADALKKCDDLASHPLDGRRYSPPISDDHFATGAATEACETAVKLNPDSGRAQFELGRSYWMAGGEHDKDAFTAFAKAAKSGYPIAFKFMGDAFLEGRGLPSSESQSPQTALVWYRKAVDAGFVSAQKAIDEVQTQIDKQNLIKKKQEAEAALKAQKEHDDAEKKRFDPLIFQNSKIMSMLYYLNTSDFDRNQFAFYIDGFVKEMKDKVIFMTDGQACAPLISGTVDSKLKVLVIDVTLKLSTSDVNRFISFITSNRENGARDALILFNRYGCDGEVTHAVIDHLNGIFGDAQRSQNRPNSERPSTGKIERATVSSLQLNIRDAPNAQANILYKMDRGVIVQITRHIDGVWVEIKVDCGNGKSCEGFVNSKYLTPYE